MLAGELGVRVALDTYPKNDIAMGAARYALHPGASGTGITATGFAPGGGGFAGAAGALQDGPQVPALPPSASEVVHGPVQETAQDTAQGPVPGTTPAEGSAPPNLYPAAVMPSGAADPDLPAPHGAHDGSPTPPGPVPAWMATGPAAQPPIDGSVDSEPGPNRRRLVILLAVGIVVVALGIGAGFVINRFLGAETAGPIGSTGEPTIAPTTVASSPSPRPSSPPDPEALGLPVGEPIGTGQLIAPLTVRSGQPAHLALVDVATGTSRDLEAPKDDNLFGVGLSLDRRTITYVDQTTNAVRTMAASGGQDRQLFTSPEGCGNIQHASWSPTDLGTFVLECQVPDEPKRLLVVKIDGSVVTELDTGQEQSGDPTVSPDGTEVAFWGASTLDQGEGGSIFVMPIDGSAPPRAVTSSEAGIDGDPAWSPDGAFLAFRHREEAGSANFDVMIVASAGGEPRLVLTGPAIDEKPTWSPDGREIVAVSNRDGDGNPTNSRDLWRVDASGGDAVPLDIRTHRIATPTWWHR